MDLIGDAVAVVALVRLHDDVETRLRVIGLEQSARKPRPVEIAVDVADQQDSAAFVLHDSVSVSICQS